MRTMSVIIMFETISHANLRKDIKVVKLLWFFVDTVRVSFRRLCNILATSIFIKDFWPGTVSTEAIIGLR